MTREVDEKLHSEAPVVMIEAAGGCGKTTKAAKYANEAAERLASGKVLLLSHTHAACGEFQRKCAALGKKIMSRPATASVSKLLAPTRSRSVCPLPLKRIWAGPTAAFRFPP